MAIVRFLQPYGDHQAGDIVEMPGGIASVLLMRHILALSDQPLQETTAMTVPLPVMTRDVPGPKDARHRAPRRPRKA